jgi:pyruvate dehydrogenase E1 component alpha subunit
MLRIRVFETQAEELQKSGEIPGVLHTSVGQEGTAVGACMALRSDDYMVGTHRSHGHPIAKGAKLGPLMAELFGKKTGVCQGKGGSMHLSDFSVGSLGETSIVGSGLPVATGAALGAKMLKNGRVSLCFFGDGASNEGAFHESLNLAAVWKLPVIFLCENNLWAIATRAADVVAVEDIAERAKSYAMAAAIVDGQDAALVYDAVVDAVERARRGEGPTLIESKTYRYAEHCINPFATLTTDRQEELEKWLGRDPLALHRIRLLEAGVQEAVLSAVKVEVEAEVADSIEFARASPYPEPIEAFDHLFA